MHVRAPTHRHTHNQTVYQYNKDVHYVEKSMGTSFTPTYTHKIQRAHKDTQTDTHTHTENVIRRLGLPSYQSNGG